jgi:hypothetical protein
MTYQATWTNGNSQGRVQAGVHRIRQCDAAELAAAINRRRLLTYQAEDDFSGFIGELLGVRRTLLSGADNQPFEDFRDNVCRRILKPPINQSPTSMQWLWPVANDDENKVIVGTSPGSGEVGLFNELNGAGTWTDPDLLGGQTSIRAVHWNELRQSLEWLVRGRWVLPLYFSGGLFSPLPDTPWFGGAIANNGTSELRTVGFAVLRYGDSPRLGLGGVTVRASSCVELTADTTCSAEVRHCLRPIDYLNDFPSWNRYLPNESLAWGTPGGMGSGDSTLVGSLNLVQNTPVQLSGVAVAAALQAMVDGAEQNIMVRRLDSGSQTVQISGRLVVEFDLVSPPN